MQAIPHYNPLLDLLTIKANDRNMKLIMENRVKCSFSCFAICIKNKMGTVILFLYDQNHLRNNFVELDKYIIVIYLSSNFI